MCWGNFEELLLLLLLFRCYYPCFRGGWGIVVALLGCLFDGEHLIHPGPFFDYAVNLSFLRSFEGWDIFVNRLLVKHFTALGEVRNVGAW